MKTNKLLLTLLAIAALALFATGCSDDDDTITTPNMGEGAMLRVVHSSPDAPEVDIYAEGVADPLIRSLGYLETSAWLELDAGMYNVQIRAAGADAQSTPVYETGLLTVTEGAEITALAVGLLGGSGDSAFRVIPVIEEYQDPGAGNAAVRIIHGSADAPAVAIDVANDGAPEITDFLRYADSGSAGVPLPAGQNLRIGIWAGEPLARVTTFTTPALPEANVLLVATGLLGELPRADGGFGLLAVGPSGTVGLVRQDPVVYALHASPDAPAVDILVGGTSVELVDGLAFGELSPPVQVSPASYELDFRVDGSGDLAATLMTPELMAGERYLAIASGFVTEEGPAFTLLPYGEAFDNRTDPLVRVVHASPDAPAVDVGVWDGMTFTGVADYADLSFGEASIGMGTALPASPFTVGIAATGTTTPVATFDLAPVTGMRAYAVAGGSLSDKGEAFRLIVVDATMWPWMASEVLPNP